jgi:hypothetical protein
MDLSLLAQVGKTVWVAGIAIGMIVLIARAVIDRTSSVPRAASAPLELGFVALCAALTVTGPVSAASEVRLSSFLPPRQPGNIGTAPLAGLVADNQGNLYGTASGASGGGPGTSTVFELSPPATAGGNWTPKLLHSFAVDSSDGFYPQAGLTFDSNGNLYGTTALGGDGCSGSGCGTVFELSPPATAGGNWTSKLPEQPLPPPAEVLP